MRAKVCPMCQPLSPSPLLPGDNAAVAAGRISYALGLQGPTYTIDTACASSICALHSAATTLFLDECAFASALSPGLKLIPQGALGAAWSGVLAVDGRCKTFDMRANGHSRGECVGAICVTKDAAAHKLSVVGLLGGAVKHNGRAASLTAPNGSAQKAMLHTALASSALSAVQVSLSETHGTGTALGDPTEVRALIAVYGPADRATSLLVASDRANVGHSDAPSGMDSLAKVVEMIHRDSAGNAQLRSCNPVIRDCIGASCMLPIQNSKRLGNDVLSYGLSSFGFGGTISHVILRRMATCTAPAHGSVTIREYRRSSFQWLNKVNSIGFPSSQTPGHIPPPQVLRIDIDTSLLEAGVNSQHAVRLAARLKHLTGANISATLIFEHPTPRAIASHLSETKDVGALCHGNSVANIVNDFVDAGSATEIPPQAKVNTTFGISIDAGLPASVYQNHFLVLHLLQPETASYAEPMALELPSYYPQSLVAVALQLLVRRHAVLRTFYGVVRSRVLQIVLPVDGFTVPLEEFDQTKWTEMVSRELASPFALTKAPPIRALNTCSMEQRLPRLFLNVHHVATDYVSHRIVHRELHLICANMLQGIAPLLRPLPIQYADYALWQHQQHLDNTYAVALQWWENKLHGAPPLLELPLDRQRPPVQVASPGFVDVLIEREIALAMRQMCIEQRVTYLSGLLTAWTVLTLRLSGQDELVVGQPQSVRSHQVFNDVAGCFVNMVPLRITVPSDASFHGVMHHVHRELLLALEHADVPFYRIVQALNPMRSNSHNPIFQTILQLLPLDSASSNEEVEDCTFDLLRDCSAGSVAIDLWTNLVERTDGALAGLMTYDTEIFHEASVRRLVMQLIAVLSYAVATSGSPVSEMELPICTPKVLSVTPDQTSQRNKAVITRAEEVVSAFEIEEALRRVPALSEVVTFVAAHRVLGEVLGVALVLRAGRYISLAEVCAALNVLLKPECLPEALVYVDDLPKDSTGKLMRSGLATHFGLPNPLAESGIWHVKHRADGRLVATSATVLHSTIHRSVVSPGNELLDRVLDAVRAHTGNEHISADTPFMSAGLNSLTAIQLAQQLERQTGVVLRPLLILQHNTSAKLAAYIHTELMSASSERPQITLDRPLATVDVERCRIRFVFDPCGIMPFQWAMLCREIPLLIAHHGGISLQAPSEAGCIEYTVEVNKGAELEERVHDLVRSSMRPEVPMRTLLPMTAQMILSHAAGAFHHSQIYNLLPTDNVTTIVSVLDALVAAHPMLRSTHTPPVFRIHKRPGYALDQAELPSRDENLCLAATALPIDLSEGVFRARSFCVDGELAFLVLCVHHVVMDGPSQQMIYSHISTLLDAARSTGATVLELDVGYDKAKIAQSVIAHHVRTFRLEASPVVNPALPHQVLDQETPFVAGTLLWNIPDTVITQLEQVIAQDGLTLSSIFLGTLAWHLHDCSGTDRFSILQTYLGRGPDEAEIVGCYSSGSPVEFFFGDHPPLRLICQRVLKETMEKMSSLERLTPPIQAPAICYELNDLRPLSRRPTPEHTDFYHVPTFDDVNSGADMLPTLNLGMDIFMMISRHTDGYQMSIRFDMRKFEQTWVQRFAQDWAGLWITLVLRHST